MFDAAELMGALIKDTSFLFLHRRGCFVSLCLLIGVDDLESYFLFNSHYAFHSDVSVYFKVLLVHVSYIFSCISKFMKYFLPGQLIY